MRKSSKSKGEETLSGLQHIDKIQIEKAKRVKELIQRGFIIPLLEEGWEGDVALKEEKKDGRTVYYYNDDDCTLLLPVYMIHLLNEEKVRNLKQVKGLKVCKIHTSQKGYISRVDIEMY